MSGGGVLQYRRGRRRGFERVRQHTIGSCEAAVGTSRQRKALSSPRENPYSAIRKVLARQADKSSASVVEIVVGSKQVALGTIVRADGWIITKASMLRTDAECRLTDGRRLSAELRHVDHEHDLAFLKVDAENLPVTTFAAAGNIKVGVIVAAVLPGELPRCGIVSVETAPRSR